MSDERRLFFGKYAAIVVDNSDPENLGRIRVRIPAVLGEVISGWALPCVPYTGRDRGMLFLPEIDDAVWVEFAAGQPERPIWVGGFWSAPTTTRQESDSAFADETGNELPTVEGAQPSAGLRVLRTRAGHHLAFDDDGGVVILSAADASATIRLTAKGEIILSAGTIQLGENASEKLILGDSFKNFFNQHTHPTGVGPSGTPTQPMSASLLSSVSKTE
ncbi:MAG: phage baseplate assembly protein V [Myxococcota bacterium]